MTRSKRDTNETEIRNALTDLGVWYCQMHREAGFDLLIGFRGRLFVVEDVKVPASWAGKEAVLHVECVDNRHETFFNGRKVGAGELDKSDYCRANLTGADLRAGEYNLVAIRVEDWGGAGGFAKQSPVLYCGDEAIELRGDWEFRTGDSASWAQWPTGCSRRGLPVSTKSCVRAKCPACRARRSDGLRFRSTPI